LILPAIHAELKAPISDPEILPIVRRNGSFFERSDNTLVYCINDFAWYLDLKVKTVA